MTDQPIRGIQPDGIQRTQGASQPENAREASAGNGAAFQALLETLQSQASRLKAHAEDDSTEPAALSGAVDSAEASLKSALDLKDQLIEAYRQALHQDDTGAGPPN